MTIFSYYLDAILDLRVKDMSEYKADARNRFPMFELVRIDLLTEKKAQKLIFFLIYVIFLWRPSWIPYCHLMRLFQDHYLVTKCYLGSILPETIIKFREPNRVSGTNRQLQD